MKYQCRIQRLQLISTAEDTEQWASRSRRQWGLGSVISVKMSAGGTVVGLTTPKPLQFAIQDPIEPFHGVSWEQDGVWFDLPSSSSSFGSAATAQDGGGSLSNSSIVSMNGSGGPAADGGSSSTNATTAGSSGAGSSNSVVLMLQVLNCHTVPPTVTGLCVLNLNLSTDGLVGRGSWHERRAAHVFYRVASGSSFKTELSQIQAIIILEIERLSSVQRPLLTHNAASSSASASATTTTNMPLNHNYGPVRLSGVHMFFPSFLNSETGEFVVSNVLCALNATENTMLSMQLVARSRAPGGKFFVVQPPDPVTVRPQQRMFFSATWPINGSVATFNSALWTLELVVLGAEPACPPVEIQVFTTPPQSTDIPAAEDVAYHYWVNTTLLSNRPLHVQQELPYVKSVLPVFMLLERKQQAWHDEAQRRGADDLQVRDRDRGTFVEVNTMHGVVVSEPRVSSHLSMMKPNPFARALQPSAPLIPTDALKSKSLQCLVQLGSIRGLPMIHTSSVAGAAAAAAAAASSSTTATGSPTTSNGAVAGFGMAAATPGFRVRLTALQEGWHVVRGESSSCYQSMSGGLRWNDPPLELRRAPGASWTQFLRLELSEVSPSDMDDEVPIGAAIVSLTVSEVKGGLPSVCPLMVAFHIFDSYSCYDKLSTSSLLMRSATITFVLDSHSS